MARRGKRQDQERDYEAYAVLEETEGPHGPERLSRSIKDPRLTHRCRGLGAAQTHEWFVDGLPVASREAARATLLLPPPPGAEPPKPLELSPEGKEALQRLVRALAIADARRDHEAEMAERAKGSHPPDDA